MKKWLWPILSLAAVAFFARLPHPARDIAQLKPVRVIYMEGKGRQLHVRTDTGDTGTGADLLEAWEDLQAKADGEVFPDTAEFLLLTPGTQVTEAFFTLLRPDCRVAYMDVPPDLETIAEYLTAHPPDLTLARLRASMKGAE